MIKLYYGDKLIMVANEARVLNYLTDRIPHATNYLVRHNGRVYVGTTGYYWEEL